MRFSEWKQLIEEGHEVEFAYEGKRYSVTYPDVDAHREPGIYFCEFYQPDVRFGTPEEFVAGAKIGDKLLKDIWKDVTDIDVY